MAARKARELVRRKSILRPSALPGKLADCSASDPREAGIYFFLDHFVTIKRLPCELGT